MIKIVTHRPPGQTTQDCSVYFDPSDSWAGVPCGSDSLEHPHPDPIIESVLGGGVGAKHANRGPRGLVHYFAQSHKWQEYTCTPRQAAEIRRLLTVPA